MCLHSLLLEMKLISGKVSALCKLTWLLSESMNYKKTDSQMLRWLSLCRPSMLLSQLPDQCRSSSHSHFKFPVCNLCKALGRKRMMQGFSIEQKKPWEKKPTPAVMTSIQMNVLGKICLTSDQICEIRISRILH